MRARNALLLVVSVALAACGSDAGDPAAEQGAAAAVPAADAVSLSTALSITEVATLQTLKASLEKGGAPVPRTVPVVAGHDAVVRVYVAPRAGVAPRPVTARLELTAADGAVLQTLTSVKTITSSSSDAALDSTFNFAVPGGSLPVGVRFAVALVEPGATPVASGVGSAARYPATGGTAAVGTVSSGPHLRVVLVPVRYMADGSGRLPDISDAQVEHYRRTLRAMYPVGAVDLTVHAPVAFEPAIVPGGSGINTLLRSMVALRAREGASVDTYYYGVVMPRATFAEYCASGCVTGLSGLLTNPNNTQRASVGVGFPGDSSARTMAHELGHAHGRRHTPCGGPSGVDPSFPHASAALGAWGYDERRRTLIDPARGRDLMSYCEPRWPSDYTYKALFERITYVNAAADMQLDEPLAPFRILEVGADGSLTWGERIELPAKNEGEELREVTYRDEAGRAVARASAQMTRYDHLDGGYLLVPEQNVPYARVSVDGYGTTP